MPKTTSRPDTASAVRVLAWVARRLEGSCAGLTLPQYRTLRLIASGGERATFLSEKLAVAKPTVTAMVDGLVAAGHLTRHVVDGDRRATRLEITSNGSAALATAEASMVEALDQLLTSLDDPTPFLAACGELSAAFETPPLAPPTPPAPPAQGRTHTKAGRT